MLTHIHPKLPMRDKAATRDFYLHQLQFAELGTVDYEGYLMVKKDAIEIHFFEFKELDPAENYGQVYIRTDAIREWYQFIQDQGLKSTELDYKPWGVMEFSMLDPDSNLLTFGQNV
ncbi:glyoxalase/bleomycin resistance/extradiol dioxygenase family protein [Siphonobacter sp. BAB-5405]|uniref:bleomycin resistance protein n=1 Tax=Siphonobacter sp. BAB-5405 TaxID=1864825 RepID=UPI000C7FE8F4|nr:VOC family protein [Siphonobacter sp. BAB-5405]PMD96559.1 glyoxalase/bleomycin resistance/extradiol dioxygenase family protein [Siphonobacter sp. BAB-5405]